jgi:glutaredoxin/glutathione-dependent peroxiredoxin
MGVDKVICIAVNDRFVLKAWEEKLGSKDKIEMLSDVDGEFTKKMDLEIDLSGAGLGKRSKRYSFIYDNGEIKNFNVEEKTELNVSGAETILKQLKEL